MFVFSPFSVFQIFLVGSDRAELMQKSTKRAQTEACALKKIRDKIIPDHHKERDF
jgi:hypothetical protein